MTAIGLKRHGYSTSSSTTCSPKQRRSAATCSTRASRKYSQHKRKTCATRSKHSSRGFKRRASIPLVGLQSRRCSKTSAAHIPANPAPDDTQAVHRQGRAAGARGRGPFVIEAAGRQGSYVQGRLTSPTILYLEAADLNQWDTGQLEEQQIAALEGIGFRRSQTNFTQPGNSTNKTIQARSPPISSATSSRSTASPTRSTPSASTPATGSNSASYSDTPTRRPSTAPAKNAASPS